MRSGFSARLPWRRRVSSSCRSGPLVRSIFDRAVPSTNGARVYWRRNQVLQRAGPLGRVCLRTRAGRLWGLRSNRNSRLPVLESTPVGPPECAAATAVMYRRKTCTVDSSSVQWVVFRTETRSLQWPLSTGLEATLMERFCLSFEQAGCPIQSCLLYPKAIHNRGAPYLQAIVATPQSRSLSVAA